MCAAEFLLWAILGFVFWKKGLQRRFPAMSTYLGLRVGSMPLLLGLLYIQARPWGQPLFPALLLCVLGGLHRQRDYPLLHLCRGLPLRAVGLLRSHAPWHGSLSLDGPGLPDRQPHLDLAFAHHGAMVIPDIAFALMRSVSILELCLLAFLCLSMNALQLVGTRYGFRHRPGLRRALSERFYAVGRAGRAITFADLAAAVRQRDR